MQITSLPLAVALLASTALAQGGKGGVHRKPPPNNITPHVVDGFLWKDPFPAIKESATVEPSCEAVKHFFAQEYTLHDLEDSEPLGLKQWAPGLKKLFKETEYPGGWSGYDRHGYDRSILKMGYSDLPIPLKEWIEQQEKSDSGWKGLFGVFKKPANKKDIQEAVVSHEDLASRETDGDQVVIFAPAAIYHTLPLWVAGGSDCKGKFRSSNHCPFSALQTFADSGLYRPAPRLELV